MLSNKKNEGENDMDKTFAPIAESLKQSLQEMQSMRSGNLKKRSWREFREELTHEDDLEEK